MKFFERALDASRRDVTQIRNGIAAELGEHEAGIYDAHLLILDDPELRRAVTEGIRSHRRNAGIVFRDYMAAVAAKLERVEDEYLRERHADVMDVERRVLRYLVGGGQRGLPDLPHGCVIVAHDIGPSDVAMLDRKRVLGLVTEVGSRTSHSAIVARGRGIAAVVGARGILTKIRSGDNIIVDGFRGEVEIQPDEETTARYHGRRKRVERDQVELSALKSSAPTSSCRSKSRTCSRRAPTASVCSAPSSST